ncbi:MAG TPA: pirin family protein [Chthoniobacteraceae bacterium]|jgi:redox-sensitive bicupin YhaK (pirin superfamily)|nr:pirin family protein [Chthoniobacteraceae bacterium]
MTTTNDLTIRRAAARGQADHGWLKATHTFSFADYYDPAHMNFRSLRVMNEDRVAPGMGFPTHPHRDMEIITYVVSGALQHKDNMGNGRVIQPGDVQYMSAGSGVEHSEFNPSRTEPVHLYQIWIMPDVKNAEPRYAEKAMAATGPGLHLVASKSGRDGSITIRQDADVFLGKLAPESPLAHTVRAGRGAWLQVVEGDVTLNGTELSLGDGASVEADAETVLALSASAPATVILFDLK